MAESSKYVVLAQSYTKDSVQIIKELEGLEWKDEYLWVTVDVTSLYTVIDHEKGNRTIIFQENRDTTIQCSLSDGLNEPITWYEYGRKASYFTLLEKPEIKKRSLHEGIFKCGHNANAVITNTDRVFIIIPPLKDSTNVTLNSTTIKEDQNVTLGCEFNSSSQSFVLFWIALYPEAASIRCVSSVEVDTAVYKYRINNLCNPTDNINRLFTNRDLSKVIDQNQRHHLKITNIKPSDSGRYLCIVQTWPSTDKQRWILVSNFSLHVTEEDKQTSKPGGPDKSFFIAIGAVAGKIIFTGIILLIVWCIKSKGKKKKTDIHRKSDAVELPENDCTPYAVSNRYDLMESPEVEYSLVRDPQQKSKEEFSEVDFKKETPESNTVYSVVNI
ncbi:PREDICTED: uncharacterized protein LOC100492795 [Pelobates cultripes]|uniref:PREDICTED: uncharacterized protein LOC100492795 n=1 Tax=Pelobates cultripes TaxID=61616 RepID=A0AAD1RLI4_PELCU|nr:PREDICTED: uncharacterized protein LOC100492795 [Pelobates cultripes]